MGRPTPGVKRQASARPGAAVGGYDLAAMTGIGRVGWDGKAVAQSEFPVVMGALCGVAGASGLRPFRSGHFAGLAGDRFRGSGGRMRR